MDTSIAVAGILGLAVILSVSIFVFGRLRIAQETTLQKLIERGATTDDLQRAAGLVGRESKDLRRGLLLIGLGLSWSGVTSLVGGRAWLFGVFPLTLGLVYVLLSALHGRSR